MKSADPTIPGLVSVVVPAYGHERFVVEALDSVYVQGHEAMELIVLDDCSKDATLETVLQWVEDAGARKRFARVVAESNPENMGAHATINRGMELAQGEFIAILNSDDRYAPDRLEILVDVACNSGKEFLFTGVQVIGEDGSRLVEPGLPSQFEAMVDVAEFFPSVSFALLSKNIAVSTGNYFFTRNLAERVGPFHNLRYCHDWDFILRASLLHEPAVVPLPLYDYRVHGSNTYASLKKEEFLEPVIVYKRFFSRGLSGYCENPRAPLPQNWPVLFHELVKEVGNLNWAYKIAGSGEVELDTVLQAYNSLH